MDRWTDMPIIGHLFGVSFVIFYLKIPNETTKLPNNLLFSVPNKCPLVRPDRQAHSEGKVNTSPKDIKKLSLFYKYRSGISEIKKLLL